MDKWLNIKGKIEMLEHNKKTLQNKIFNLKNDEKLISNSIDFLYSFSEYTNHLYEQGPEDGIGFSAQTIK
ncbi:MAG: hypothetical protein R6U08_09555 [Bacillota bacterium]